MGIALLAHLQRTALDDAAASVVLSEVGQAERALDGIKPTIEPSPDAAIGLQCCRPDVDQLLCLRTVVAQQSEDPAIGGVRGVDAVDRGRAQGPAVGDRVSLLVGELPVRKQQQAGVVERQAQPGPLRQIIE